VLFMMIKSTNYVEKTWGCQSVCSLKLATKPLVEFSCYLGTEFLDKGKPSNKHYFHENRLTESHTLMKVVNEFLIIMSV
jgi:hypothetical protein